MPAAPTLKKSGRRRFRLHNIDWRTYVRLLHAFEEQPAIRLTYDRGELEIMSPTSVLHDHVSRFLGRMIVALTEYFKLPIWGAGSATLKRQLQKKGIEPDECFWIRNAARMAGKTRLDLRRDPPPDLAVEIDVSRSSLDRLAIYAALGVSEVWNWEDDVLTFYVLSDEGLRATDTSGAFPGVRAVDLIPFLIKARNAPDENAVEQEFREWLGREVDTSAP